jgi:hypothetical protein
MKGRARIENRILEDHGSANSEGSSTCVTKKDHEIRLQAVELDE